MIKKLKKKQVLVQRKKKLKTTSCNKIKTINGLLFKKLSIKDL